MVGDPIGGLLNQIDLKTADDYVQHAIKEKYEYLQVCWCKNGLGPKAMFNFYKLRLRKSDSHPSDNWEIDETTKEYLIEKYPEIKVY